MPDRIVKPIVNQEELSIELIADVAATFQTSFVSAALRAVECSHFCGAVVAIREGQIAWMRRSDPLIENNIYPGERGPIRSKGAQEAWATFDSGGPSIPARAGWARDWFRIYDDELRFRLPVTEMYLPARIIDTLLVILTVPEDELWNEDE